MQDLPNNSILIIPSIIKETTIKKLRQQNISNIKVMTMTELRKKYYFDYDEKAIYHLIKNYGYQYDVAKMYLSHLYEVEENDFNSPQIKKIIELKKDLIKQDLLIKNPFFKPYLKDKILIFYKCNPITKLDSKMIEELKQITSVQVISEENQNNNHEIITEFDTIEEEVHYLASKICSLINEGINLTKIKICGATNEYNDIIKRIFEWYHIPISFNDNYLYSTKIAQDFLKNLSDNVETSLEYIKEKYSLEKSTNLEIYNTIVTILNKYSWSKSPLDIKEFLLEEFKNTKINISNYCDEITIIADLREVEDDEIVFLLGFNQGSIPKTYKDESYFNDTLKEKLGLDTTNELNQINYNKWLNDIKNTKNLIITSKKNSSLGPQYLSSLNDDLKLEIKPGTITYQYSNIYNQLLLTSQIDTLLKYNEKSSNMDNLFSTYPNIPYQTYTSNYQKIDQTRLKKYLGSKLTLSYSSMNTYYQCSFRYYLSNILKLNIFEETFYTVLGNLFHHILSLAFQKEINITEEVKNYLKNCNYPFDARERFFLKKLEKELAFIIQVIKNQNEYSSLNKVFYEEKIEIPQKYEETDVVFKGFIDKLITNEEESILTIIDYKTGNPNLNLNNVVHGLDLQLPVYIYLAKTKFPKASIAGFYLQKILNTEISKDYKNTYEDLKRDKLKLQGYSNKDTSILEKFDSSYCNSKVIKGFRMTSKGIGTKKVLDDIAIDKLNDLTVEKINQSMINILKANFDINPKRIGMDNLGCKYCSFKDICFFTEENIENLKEYKNMEFLGGETDDTEETE